MMVFRCAASLLGSLLLPAVLLMTVPGSSGALPVPLGEIEIGLESFDGYQEGRAYLSTDEAGTNLEILIAYKGFGLDTVSWVFPDSDLLLIRAAGAQAAWWRSRLLEMNVGQTVERDITATAPEITYNYRGSRYPVDAADTQWRFERQGSDYALVLIEDLPGAEERRLGKKNFPVFTLHIQGAELPVFRDMLSEATMEAVLANYAAEKDAITAILESAPE